ncbi:histidine kinase dimerization/phosphoacceptor domain -containing protein [Aquabacterium sp.]|uniref:histidine kinase dimerization/phosphoacceptor domain -containing protein n=1 Tax=Aquabacterium sp. TaxID=1872578 RepID=UPI002C875A9E|nr:histidine kinase dimerization/phosphoacceptor domain -containing protein [Aquabacterium sp.]HSW04833.1 histidine kinase dimerization/phosphoacceptor domain -containing protein [Aquabacterium sp.]
MTGAALLAAGTAVLLVEDDDATAELERRVLTRSGFEVRRVTSVAQAVSALRSEPLQAVLLDYQLPDGDPWAVVDAAREKDSLLKEIHHRVKNNMQVISSLLQLQSGEVKSPEARHALTASQNRIKSMAVIHEKLYERADLAAIDFTDYVGRLVTMRQAQREIGVPASIALHAAPVTIGIDRAIPAGLLLNDLLSNALTRGGAPGRLAFEHVDGFVCKVVFARAPRSI